MLTLHQLWFKAEYFNPDTWVELLTKLRARFDRHLSTCRTFWTISISEKKYPKIQSLQIFVSFVQPKLITPYAALLELHLQGCNFITHSLLELNGYGQGPKPLQTLS